MSDYLIVLEVIGVRSTGETSLAHSGFLYALCISLSQTRHFPRVFPVPISPTSVDGNTDLSMLIDSRNYKMGVGYYISQSLLSSNLQRSVEGCQAKQISLLSCCSE